MVCLTPDAEIWRWGADLQNIHQLVVGDDVYMECTPAGDSGLVMAAVGKNEAVRIAPHCRVWCLRGPVGWGHEGHALREKR